MYEGKRIAVTIPCYNEEKLVTTVLSTMPNFVDRMYVVDDVSKDNTVAVVQAYQAEHPDEDIVLIQHEENQGVGGAIITGYLAAAADEMDVTVVMAGDAQMDPVDLPNILDPVVHGEVDYSKGNRLATGEAFKQIPKIRYFGNVALSLATKIASGYWHLFDSQTGYTAITREAIEAINWDTVWKRYGCPNHFLVRLNIHNFRVRDVPIRAVYDIGEVSTMRIWRVMPTIAMLLVRGFFERMIQKYIIRDAHPLVLFYIIGTLAFVPGMLFGLYLLGIRIIGGRPIAGTSALFAMFLIMFGLNFLMFALWFDMDANKDLR